MLFFLFFVSEKIDACLVQNCETCSFQSPNICINCDSGYTRDRVLGCIQSQNNQILQFGKFFIENCASYNSNSTCEACFEGYSLINSRCSPICKDNCSCFEPNECLEDTSIIKDPSYCISRNLATNECIQCSSGFYLLEADCYSCTFHCSSCSSSTCYQCDGGYYLSGGSCYSCPSQCSYCSNSYTCSQCNAGYYLYAGSCYSCPSKCSYCSESYSCTECNTDYYLKNGYCCGYQCSSCYSYGCSQCNIGYYSSGFDCYSCPSDCDYCYSSTYCYQCADGYSNEHGSCEKSSKVPIVLILSLVFVIVS